MKKIIRKVYAIILLSIICYLFVIHYSFVEYSAFASENNFVLRDISLEKGAQGGLDRITLDSYNDSFSIIFGVVYSGTGYVRINANLPSGLRALSYEILSESGSRCLKPDGGVEIDDYSIFQNDTNFFYSFKGNGICEAIVKADYETNGISVGSQNINYGYFEYSDSGFTNMIYNGVSSNVTLNITNNIVLNSAKTIDNNNNGLIDGLNLTFSRVFDRSLFDLSNINSKLTLGGFDGTTLNYSLSNNSGNGTGVTLLFSENQNWDTGIRPFLNLQSFSNGGVTFESVTNLIPIDGANPVLLSINNSDAVNGTGDVTITGTSNIVFEFSEQMNDSTILSGITLRDKDNNLVIASISSSGTRYILDPIQTLYSDRDPYTYYISWVSDWAGNTYSRTGAINIIDNVSPYGNAIGTNIGIQINRGDTYTNSQTGIVTLTLSGSDDNGVTEMIIGNDDTFSSSAWEAYNSSKTWTLTGTEGVKTVYVKFKDAIGNESPIYSDSIIWDKSIPTISFSLNSGNFNSPQILTMSGNPSGMEIYYTLDGTIPTKTNGTIYTTGIVMGTGSITVYNFKIRGFYENLSTEIYSRSYTFSCPSIENGVNSGYPNCTLTCNSGYVKVGNACIAYTPSTGGGGGGGISIPTCLDSQLECKLVQNSYYWQLKPGVSCIGGNLGKSCSTAITENNNVTTSQGGIIDEIVGKINIENIETWSGMSSNVLKKTKNYLASNSDKSLHKLIDIFGRNIDYEFIDYFILIDEDILKNYNLLLENYKALFTNINYYLTSKDKGIIPTIKLNYNNYNKYYKLTKDLELRYILKTKKGTDVIYETKLEKLKPILGKIEKMIIGKCKKLLGTSTISQDEYKKAVENYNKFVFYLSAYKVNKDVISKNTGKFYLNEILKVYSKKIIPSKTPKITTKNKILVKDIYSFDRDLKLNDYNENVKNLQLLLKHYNYFPFEATGYFGKRTLNYLQKFSVEFLKTEFPGYLDSTLRSKILELEY